MDVLQGRLGRSHDLKPDWFVTHTEYMAEKKRRKFHHIHGQLFRAIKFRRDERPHGHGMFKQVTCRNGQGSFFLE